MRISRTNSDLRCVYQPLSCTEPSLAALLAAATAPAWNSKLVAYCSKLSALYYSCCRCKLPLSSAPAATRPPRPRAAERPPHSSPRGFPAAPLPNSRMQLPLRGHNASQIHAALHSPASLLCTATPTRPPGIHALVNPVPIQAIQWFIQLHASQHTHNLHPSTYLRDFLHNNPLTYSGRWMFVLFSYYC